MHPTHNIFSFPVYCYSTSRTRIFEGSATWVVGIIALILAAGCGSPKIRGSVSPGASLASPIRSVMVVGKDERPEIRSQFENDVAAALRKHQVEAVSSYQQFSLDDLKGDREQIRQKFADAKAQSVLIVRLVKRGSFVGGPPGTIGDITPGAVEESAYVRFTEGGGDIETALRLGAKL